MIEDTSDEEEKEQTRTLETESEKKLREAKERIKNQGLKPFIHHDGKLGRIHDDQDPQVGTAPHNSGSSEPQGPSSHPGPVEAIKVDIDGHTLVKDVVQSVANSIVDQVDQGVKVEREEESNPVEATFKILSSNLGIVRPKHLRPKNDQSIMEASRVEAGMAKAMCKVKGVAAKAKAKGKARQGQKKKTKTKTKTKT